MPAAFLPTLSLGTAETWRDRLRGAQYIAPSGTKHDFKFVELSRSFTLRGTPFEFPEINDAYVQQRGFGPRRYPWRCIFTGPDHDRLALAFEAGLIERGIGRLEHPLYGTIPRVVPLGEVTRREDMVNAAGESIVEVTFWTTVSNAYPQAAASDTSEISAALAGFGAAAANDFAEHVFLKRTVDKANALATLRAQINQIAAAMQGVSDRVSSARAVYEDFDSTLRRGLDVLIGQPLLLAQQISNLIQAPGKSLLGIQARLAGYGRLLDSIIGSSAANPAATLDLGSAIPARYRKITNDLRLSDLIVSNAVAGSASAANDYTFGTRGEALRAADDIANQFDLYLAWRDAGFDALSGIDTNAQQVDTGDSYQALQEAVALLLGRLVQASFDLIPERRLVLGRPRTMIDLCGELYGSVDDKLDFMITSNDLVGDELLQIPAGRAIVYYPSP